MLAEPLKPKETPTAGKLTPSSGEAQPANARNKAPSDRWDWAIASLCISAGVLGLRTVNDPALWNRLALGRSSGQPIGVLNKKKGGVRFRPQSSVLWHDVYSESEAVVAGDTVFTGEDGQAELKLNDGSVAEIEPNSLVVVQQGSEVLPEKGGWLGSTMGALLATSKPESLLQIESGAARVNLKKDAKPLKLQVKGKVYNLAARAGAAQAEISVENRGTREETAKVASLSASGVELSESSDSGETAKVQVGQGQEAVLRGTSARGAKAFSLQTVLMTPILPAAGEQMIQPPEVPVSFTWRWDGDFDSSAPVQLELEGPSKKAVPVRGSSQLASVLLPEGAYRWRLSGVQAANAPRAETSWRSFTLVALAPPQPYGPREGAALAAGRDSGNASVVMSWRSLRGGLQAEVEWTQTAEAGAPQPKPRHAVSDSAGWQTKLSPGEYRWRVRARTPDGGQFSNWSKPMVFRVESAERPASVAVAPPPVVAPPPQAVAPPPVAAPAPVKVAAKKAPPPPPPPKPKPKRILAVANASGSTKLGNLERLDELTVPLRWKGLEDAKYYELSISESGSGKRVLKKKTEKPEFDWPLKSLQVTKFKYQVTAVTKEAEQVPSAPVAIEIVMSPPALKTPSNSAQVQLSRQGSILITWERTVLTDAYRVQIARDPAFTQGLRDGRVPRNLMSVKGLAAKTRYYWRVQGLISGRPSEWSESWSFVVDPRN